MQGSDGFRRDSARRDGVLRRGIPSVGDLVDAMAHATGIPAQRKGELFDAAQQTCAEERRLVRTGFEPSPVSELVARAVRLLPADLGGDRFQARGWNEDAPFSQEPLETGNAAWSADDPFRIGRSDPEETGESEPEPPEEPVAWAAPNPSSRSGRLSVLLLIAAIGGGIYLFTHGKRIAAPTSPPFEGTASPAVPPPQRSAPPATAMLPASPAISGSHDSSRVSSDWADPSTAYMIHVSSFRKKENADRDAARLGKMTGRPLHVIQVNLGKDGIWYRVMLGDFSSGEEAQAYREELVGKGTPGLGQVYRVPAL
jgi:cell division septation protein DedD